MAPHRHIFIVGAGISGLTLALALARFGLRVTVLERTATLDAAGAGIQISPNARRILDHLGLDTALEFEAFTPAGIDVWPQSASRPIQTFSLGDSVSTRFGAPYAVLHRADLARALFDATRRFANIEILFSVDALAVDRSEGGVRVRYREAGRAEIEAPAFALVGADGVNSTLRAMLGAPEAIDTGVTAWRALADAGALGNGLKLDRTTVLLAPGHHMVIYPLPFRGVVNLVLLSQRRADSGLGNDATLPAPSSHPVIRTLVDRVGPQWTPWRVRTHTQHSFGDGPVMLIGDAAHAMLPFAAQGAAMGIEDAATLATLIATAPNAAHARDRLHALRSIRLRKVAALSRANGRIFHLPWPASTARNMAIRFGGPASQLDRLAWIYSYDVGGGAGIAGPNPPA